MRTDHRTKGQPHREATRIWERDTMSQNVVPSTKSESQPHREATRIWEKDTTLQDAVLSAKSESQPHREATRIWEKDTTLQDAVLSAKSEPHLRKRPAFLRQAQHIWAHTPVAIVAIIVGLITLLVHGYRLGMAPDVFSDEGIYLLVGANLAKGNGLTLNNSAFLWHPPAYMLIEAVYIKLVGLTNADALTALLSVRYLNIFLSACTAILILLFGRKLHSYKAGFIMVALFLMDPYVQRINRRSMLETLAMLCVLLGVYLFFTRRQHLTKWQCLGSGVAFGLAILTKEVMFLQLFALIATVVWFRRSQLVDVARVTGIASVITLPYVIWEVAVGRGNDFLFYQFYGVARILSIFTNHSASSQPMSPVKTSSLDNFWILLSQYGMSYLLIALAALFTVVLFFRFRHFVIARDLVTWFRQLTSARYLVTWSICNFVIGLVLGRVSDQYFYYLIVPSIIVVGYVIASFLETFLHSRSSEKTSVFNQDRQVFPRNSLLYKIMCGPMFLLFLLMFFYNGYVWANNYVIGSDDSYVKIMEYAKANIPSGETIVTSDDVAYYFLSPSYNIRLDRDPKLINDKCERYFIMSSKDAWGGYDAMTQQFYDWVMENSSPLFIQNDKSFWTIGVYMRTTTCVPGISPGKNSNDASGHTSPTQHNLSIYFMRSPYSPKGEAPQPFVSKRLFARNSFYRKESIII